MAETGENGTELGAHAQTFAGFKTMMVWGTIGCVLVAALVVFLIAN